MNIHFSVSSAGIALAAPPVGLLNGLEADARIVGVGLVLLNAKAHALQGLLERCLQCAARAWITELQLQFGGFAHGAKEA